MVYLMMMLKNKMNLFFLILVCELGVFEVFFRYLMMKNVIFFREEDNVLMDVMNIMLMLLVDFFVKYFMGNFFSKVKIELFMLEIFLYGVNKERVLWILDILLMKEIEKIYNVINVVIFIILVFFYIMYMGFFSYVGIEILKEFCYNFINIIISFFLYVFVYIVVLMELLIFFLYFIMLVIDLIKCWDFINLVL